MVQELTIAESKKILDAAEEKAEELGVPLNLAVTNSEGNLLGFRRMDGAKLVASNIAQNKAYTAAAVKKPTHELKEGSEPGGDVYGLHTTDNGRVVVFGGGFPVEHDGVVVGAVGASGGAVSEDMEASQAGLEAFEPLR
ncbi:DNA polymerase III subunit delta' [Haloferax sp. Atlit-4N]|uniref:GlcG/HbpS family heme-binding protein n=1 Tax=Haloferax sp. Atlit-4N TaxID=2077206 RepID=UPI000E223942|nr:heme-binding protein [Haloferax sp. Atlit-4N]RDZ51034.1 DNA polymerase III subunit delta' [Haloferax sp. Atlit-4N]